MPHDFLKTLRLLLLSRDFGTGPENGYVSSSQSKCKFCAMGFDVDVDGSLMV